MLNRRTFFQTAALSTAAVLHLDAKHGSGFQAPTIPAGPFEVDLLEPGAAAFVGRPETALFVRLAELEPADSPGDLSGAKLFISDADDHVCVSASMGEVQQRDGRRTSHWLGCMGASEIRQLVAADPSASEGSLSFVLGDPRRPTQQSIRLTFFGGDEPELWLTAWSHCLGVLRGRAAVRFLDCLRQRAAIRMEARSL